MLQLRQVKLVRMFTPALFEDPQYGTCIRIHVAGGSTHAPDWVTLAECASDCADGFVYIDRFSAIELRGITDAEALKRRLQGLHLHAATVPVLASPLSAAAKQAAQDIAAELGAIEGGPGLAVIAEEDSLPAGAAGVSLNIDKDGSLHLGRSPLVDAPTAPLTPHAAARHYEEALQRAEAEEHTSSALAEPGPIGWLDEHLPAGIVDLGAGVHKGAIPAEFAQLIGQLEVDITVTPWGGLVFHNIAEGDAEVVLRVLAPRGFIFDINSPLLRAQQQDRRL